jgi:energy-coupling factor transport system substrate-specific component
VSVSWPVAAFLVLFVALALGFAWYERTHPSSRVLALVATLAALAALGRIAFAPLPNIKPTTDIVLLSGFALGGAPGFAVGAVAALASNLVFGQGPWTPWQMGAWGLVGVFGAALGAATGHRLGRVGLAVACGVAGAGFGLILDFSTWITFVGDHTLRSFLAYSATSLSFNVAHVVGNVLFCLAFGPALVRAIGRSRERLEVTWRPAPAALPPAAIAVAAAGVVAAALAAGLAAPAPAHADVRSRAVEYLVSARTPDGGFGAAPGEPASPLTTAWAAMGLVAAGRPCDAPLAAALRTTARSVRDTGDIERTLLALRACGAGDAGLEARLLARRRADGSWEQLVNRTAFGVLALRASGRTARDPRVRAGAAWVARQQNRDGGFSFAQRGAPSSTDDTAAALQALVAAGRPRDSAPVRRAATFLARAQRADGGFPLSPGGASNAQSTAWAVQALVAAGRDPSRVRRGPGRSGLGYLTTLAGPDGAIRYSRSSRQSPVWVTAQALTALARRPFPVRPRSRGTRAMVRSATLTTQGWLIALLR